MLSNKLNSCRIWMGMTFYSWVFFYLQSCKSKRPSTWLVHSTEIFNKYIGLNLQANKMLSSFEMRFTWHSTYIYSYFLGFMVPFLDILCYLGALFLALKSTFVWLSSLVLVTEQAMLLHCKLSFNYLNYVRVSNIESFQPTSLQTLFQLPKLCRNFVAH